MMIYEILNKHKHSISNCVCSTQITRPPSRWPILVNNLGLALPRHAKPGRLLPQGVKIAVRRFQKRSDLSALEDGSRLLPLVSLSQTLLTPRILAKHSYAERKNV